MATKLFDLHIQVDMLNAGGYSAKTILGNNSILLQKDGPTITTAVDNLIGEIDSVGAFQMLTVTPSLSNFPFSGGKYVLGPGGSPVPAAVPTPKPSTKPAGTVTGRHKSGGPPPTPRHYDPNFSQKKKDPVLERPVDLSSVAYPTCTAKCQSHDIFGAGKCKNMCRTKAGV